MNHELLLSSRDLEKRFKFRLENGLEAMAYSTKAADIRAQASRLRPNETYWPLINDDTLKFLIVDVKLKKETIRLVYTASTECGLIEIVDRLHRGLKRELNYIAYVIYQDSVYFGYDRTAVYLCAAVTQKIAPSIAALVLSIPEQN